MFTNSKTTENGKFSVIKPKHDCAKPTSKVTPIASTPILKASTNSETQTSKLIEEKPKAIDDRPDPSPHLKPKRGRGRPKKRRIASSAGRPRGSTGIKKPPGFIPSTERQLRNRN